MKRKMIAMICAVSLTAGLLAGCGQSGGTGEGSGKAENGSSAGIGSDSERDDAGTGSALEEAEGGAKEEVVVTMPVTSEPESGFDPAYGWGAGEHVHEPLIQSTLVVTNKELQIENDLATEYGVSDDGMTWTVKIRDDVIFTDGEPLTAADVAFTYNNCKEKSSVNDFTMLESASATDDTTVEFKMTKP